MRFALLTNSSVIPVGPEELADIQDSLRGESISAVAGEVLATDVTTQMIDEDIGDNVPELMVALRVWMLKKPLVEWTEDDLEWLAGKLEIIQQ